MNKWLEQMAPPDLKDAQVLQPHLPTASCVASAVSSAQWALSRHLEVRSLAVPESSLTSALRFCPELHPRGPAQCPCASPASLAPGLSPGTPLACPSRPLAPSSMPAGGQHSAEDRVESSPGAPPPVLAWIPASPSPASCRSATATAAKVSKAPRCRVQFCSR